MGRRRLRRVLAAYRLGAQFLDEPGQTALETVDAGLLGDQGVAELLHGVLLEGQLGLQDFDVIVGGAQVGSPEDVESGIRDRQLASTGGRRSSARSSSAEPDRSATRPAKSMRSTSPT